MQFVYLPKHRNLTWNLRLLNNNSNFLFNLVDLETSGSSPTMAFAALIFGSIRRWMPSHLSRPRRLRLVRPQGTEHGTQRSHLAWKSCILALQSPERIRIALRSLFNQSNLNFWCLDCQESCSLAALHKYDTKCDLKNPMCLSIPLKYFSGVWDMNTGDSSIKSAAAITSRYQADQSSMKRSSHAKFTKFFPIHFRNCFKNINKNMCPLIEEWSWSRALPPFSCPHVVALKLPIFAILILMPPPPSWQLSEVLILEEMQRNATS